MSYNEKDEDMKHRKWVIIGVTAVATASVLWWMTAAKSEPAAPPPVTQEFTDGFCFGWNSAVRIEEQRANNWRALVTVARTDEGAQTQVGKTVDLMVNSMSAYVLMQSLTGKVRIDDGREIDCTPKPVAVEQPVKPGPVAEPPKPTPPK